MSLPRLHILWMAKASKTRPPNEKLINVKVTSKKKYVDFTTMRIFNYSLRKGRVTTGESTGGLFVLIFILCVLAVGAVAAPMVLLYRKRHN